MLTVINPATGEMVKQLVTDTATSIADKVESARSVQKSWFRRLWHCERKD